MELSTWLQNIAAMNDQSIRLGLERTATVAQTLGVLKQQAHCFTVAGTNGKGSTVAALEQIYVTAGYRVGCFTSPYLFRYTEQIRINGVEVDENQITAAFEAIEKARNTIVLTPFEWLTLAALVIFQAAKLDIIVLEVGLGGRLDATNVVDTDIAIITSISLDHCEYLGATRDSIGLEKAGILRPNKPAIYGEASFPDTILKVANQIGAPFYRQGAEFNYHEQETEWSWTTRIQPTQYQHLPYNGLYPQNLSTALMAVHLASSKFPVTETVLRTALSQTQLAGRVECVQQPCDMVYDVAHNPAACQHLAQSILKMAPVKNKAIFSMLKDKDMVNSLRAMRDVIHAWYVAPLTVARGASMQALQAAFDEADIRTVYFYKTLADAHHAALNQHSLADRLIVFGSFHTVAAVKSLEVNDSTSA